MKRSAIFSLPDGMIARINFNKSPGWLRLLSLTPIMDAYAYSLALNRGLGEIWPIDNKTAIEKSYSEIGWVIHEKPMSDYELFLEGAVAHFRPRTSKTIKSYWLPKVFSPLPLTSWGREERSRRFVHISNGTYMEYKKQRMS